MYPKQARRNYRNFFDGLTRVAEEGALFRGAGAYGLKLAGLFGGISLHDFLKENIYYFFGPITMMRWAATAGGVAVAMAASMPFDTVATRLHTMRPLPNGELPYQNALDCFNKIWYYEGRLEKHSNLGCFYSGGQAYFLRLFLIAIVSQYALDYYYDLGKQTEFWQPARYHYHTSIDYDIHEPFTDAYNKQMLWPFKKEVTMTAFHPHTPRGGDPTFYIV